MKVLGIETSCDETGVALYDGERGLLAHALYSQAHIHAEYGGVVPEIAARAHVERILPVIDEALLDSDNGNGDGNTIYDNSAETGGGIYSIAPTPTCNPMAAIARTRMRFSRQTRRDRAPCASASSTRRSATSAGSASCFRISSDFDGITGMQSIDAVLKISRRVRSTVSSPPASSRFTW